MRATILTLVLLLGGPAHASAPVPTAPDATAPGPFVLNGVRVPLRAFRGVRLDRLAAVELRFGATGRGSVQLAELAFQVS